MSWKNNCNGSSKNFTGIVLLQSFNWLIGFVTEYAFMLSKQIYSWKSALMEINNKLRICAETRNIFKDIKEYYDKIN